MTYYDWCVVLLENNQKDKFTEVKLMTVIETTHGSLNLHIPSTVAKALGFKQGQLLICSQNKATKTIQYQYREEDQPIEEKKEE